MSIAKSSAEARRPEAAAPGEGRAAQPYVQQVRIYYEDTDAGGVVFYANYLKFFERCRTDWLRAMGINQTALAEQSRRLFVVKGLEIQYRRPARLDDLLTIHSTVTRVGVASLHFLQKAYRDGELLCESTIQVCCIDADRFRPAELPETLRHQLEQALN